MKHIFFVLFLVAIVCVTLLDRVQGDQITQSTDSLLSFQERPFEIVGNYIKNRLQK